MKTINLRKLLTVLGLTCSVAFSAKAALITEQWSATVTSSTNAAYSVGDAISWNLLYDDSIGILSVYVYDTLGVENRDTDRRVTKDITSVAYSSSYSLFADAVIDFNGLFDNMFGALSTPTVSNSHQTIYNDQRWADMSGNRFIEQFRDNSYFSTNGNTGYATIYTIDSGTSQRRTQKIEFGFVNLDSAFVENDSSTVSVSEPSTFAFFALALAGIGIRRSRISA